MRSASIADWILRRIMGKERAASMVGDLVEISQRKGMVWFWLSVAGVVVARIWRPALGLMLLSYSGFWILFKVTMALTGSGRHYAGDFWQPVLGIFALMGVYLCWAMVYSVPRFGLRDRFVQTASAVAALCVVLMYGWWQPVVLGCCIAGFAGIVAISVLSRERRRAVLVLPVLIATTYLSIYLGNFLAKICQLFVLYGPLRGMGQREVHEHPSVLWMGLLGTHSLQPHENPVLAMMEFWVSQVIHTLVIAGACEILRRWSMSKPQNGPASEDGKLLPDIS